MADTILFQRIIRELQRRQPQTADEARRIAWEVAYGPVPEDVILGMTCANPDCCNPDHLYLMHLQ